MNRKQRKTLEQIYTRPTLSTIAWSDVESLFKVVGATVSQGQGSRVRVALRGVRATFHEPHLQKGLVKGAVEDVRRFLENAGVKP